MKNLFTLLFLCFCFSLSAQNDITVKINHKSGTEDLVLDEAVETYEGYNLTVERLDYYLNDFKITHDGGTITSIADHFLVKVKSTTQNATLSLGSFDITNVENISFSIGVHPDFNHLDPSLLGIADPLAPQNPSMHWGWTAGYRFIALEGNTGANLGTAYEIHALGDQNYKTISIPVGATLESNTLTINLDADYLGMYKNIDLPSGVLTHGDYGEAVILLNNFETEVFTASNNTPVSVIDPNFEGKFQIQPNPSFHNNTNVILDLPTADNYQLTLTDITGRVIQTQNIDSGEHNIEVKSNQSGIFFIHLWKDGEPVAFEKWFVK